MKIVVENNEFEEKYKDIKGFKIKRFCEIFNDCPHVGAIKTPYTLCEEMLAQLPDLNDKSILILFNPEFYATIINKYPWANITFLTGSKHAASMKFRGAGTYYMNPFEDVDSLEGNVKFDVVIGNPPYQAPKNRKGDAKNGTCGSVLWKDFLMKSIELCKDDGFISLIHPGQWRKPDSKLLETIKSLNLKYLEIHNLDDGMKVFKAATGFDWYVIAKQKYGGKTKIKGADGIINEEDISEINFIPNSDFDMLRKLIAKKEEEKCNIIFNRTNYGTDKAWISKTQDDIFKYPCVYGLTQRDGLKLFYSSKNDSGHFGIKKIIIPISKYTDAFIDDEGKYGLCQFAFGIRIDSEEEGENIKKAITSDEFKKVWQAIEWIYNSKEWRVFKSFRKDFWKDFI
ncbi:MAG: Eco57I restriction-modification methylase domain-containing protein [Patescibacteria group bacterium]